MRYRALACDFDGTLAEAGTVAPAVSAALVRLRATGVCLILVTGRRLGDLDQVCPEARAIFDAIVAENGGVLLRPTTSVPRRLGPAPPPELLERLRDRGVAPVVAGDVVVATLRRHEAEAVAAIRALGLDLEVVYNKAALMLLPAGLDKGSGLDAALAELGIAPGETIAIGDGENDLPLLVRCGLGVTVAGAVPALEAAADVVTRGGAGEGVAEIAEAMLGGDQAALAGA